MPNLPDAITVDALSVTNRRFEAAVRAQDTGAIADVYTSTGSIMPPNHPIVSGRDNMIEFWTMILNSGVGAAELTTVELDLVGNTVNEVGKYILTDTKGNTADEGKFIVIWKQENGAWRWHHDCFCSSLSAA